MGQNLPRLDEDQTAQVPGGRKRKVCLRSSGRRRRYSLRPRHPARYPAGSRRKDHHPSHEHGRQLISYSENAHAIVDEFELALHEAYEATPRAPIEYYLGMHIQRDRKNRLLTLDAGRHIYEFIQMMGLDPHTSSSVGTPLDPAIT